MTSKIAAKDLTTLAIGHMGFTSVETKNLKDQSHNDLGQYQRDILIIWRNKNSSEPDIQLVGYKSSYAYSHTWFWLNFLLK